ncbi:ATP-binding protein [Moorellaceae bacterium AZ2]
MFKKAMRKQAKIRLALFGPSGSGKTYSALLIARGLVGQQGRIAVIDTERGSASLYADITPFDVCELEPPFTPEKYIEAIKAAEQGGYDVIIIDSLSHAWAGTGGILDIHDAAAAKEKNSWSAWRLVTPRHNDLVDAMLQSTCHVIATLRAKQEYVPVEDGGKTKIQKVGLAPVQRDGLEYEFTLVFNLDASHNAVASKDRTQLFDGQVVRLSPATGMKLREWLEGAAGAPADPVPQPEGPRGGEKPVQVPLSKQHAQQLTQASQSAPQPAPQGKPASNLVQGTFYLADLDYKERKGGGTYARLALKRNRDDEKVVTAVVLQPELIEHLNQYENVEKVYVTIDLASRYREVKNLQVVA